MAVARIKAFSCFFVCAVSVLLVAKSCLAGCGDGQCLARTRREANDENSSKIPLSIAEQLNEADSFEEILAILHPSAAAAPVLSEPVLSRKSTSLTSRVKNAVSSIFGRKSSSEGRGSQPESSSPTPAAISARFGGGGIGREDVVIEQRGPKKAKPAKCQPMLVPVSVPQPSDPNIRYYPECVLLEQCGGCCNAALYQCEPTRTEKVPVQVVVHDLRKLTRAPATSDGRTPSPEKTEKQTAAVIMEKHIKCKCDCKVKKEHCNLLQRHESCECVCTNTDERTKCLSNPKKIWDKNRCACSCKEIEDCTTGLEFDENICSCVVRPQPVSTRIGTLSADGRYETKNGRNEEKRIRRWGNGNSTRYTVVPSS